MRFLCLHGQGTNAEILKSQLAPLSYALQDGHHEFEFVEGELACGPAPGVAATYPEQSQFFEYFNSDDIESVREAIDGVHELLTSEEPAFDGIIGFSQGAFIALTVLAQQAQNPARSPRLSCAVILCAGRPPYDFVKGRFFESYRDGSKVIQIPTFHSYGRQDDSYAAAMDCVKMCAPTVRGIYEHKGGHELPKTAPEVALLVGGVKDCMERALLVQ